MSELPRHDQYENNTNQEIEKAPVDIMRRALAVAVVIGGVVGGLAIENRELLHAAWNKFSYEEPDADDIIPETTGCNIDNQAVEKYLAAQKVPIDITNETSDVAFNKVFGAKSVSTSTPIPVVHDKETSFEYVEKLFWPGENYFDRIDGDTFISPSTHIEFIKVINEEDPEYDINWSELERYMTDVFKLKELYKHPGILDIVNCYQKRYQDNEAGGLPVEFSVLYDDRLCTNGNVVAKLRDGQSWTDCRETGFGSPDISISIFPGIKYANSRYLVVAGAEDNTDGFEEAINRRLRHEILHIIFFSDLSDFTLEADEQERATQYIEKVLRQYYKDTNTTPMILSGK